MFISSRNSIFVLAKKTISLLALVCMLAWQWGLPTLAYAQATTSPESMPLQGEEITQPGSSPELLLQDVVAHTESTTTAASIATGDAVAVTDVTTIAHTTEIDTPVSNGDLPIGCGSIDGCGVATGTTTDGMLPSSLNNPFASTTDGALPFVNIEATSTQEIAASTSVAVDVDSGGNTIAYATGDATITTGDVYAGTTLINILNTNLIGSNVVLSVINVFGEWLGDLILPGEGDFTRESVTQEMEAAAREGSFNLRADANATVVNDIFVVADTGGNTVENAGGGADVTTGNAVAVTNVENHVNTVVIGGDWILGHVAVLNQWLGNVWGLPLGASVNESPTGISVEAMGQVGTTTGALADATTATTTGATSASAAALASNQTAVLHNTVNINASSGGNAIENAEGGASITTGNVQVLTDIMNIANSTVVGGKVILAFVNVFGTWGGNLAFGRPDLKISKSIRYNPDPPTPDGYEFHRIYYINMGNGRAHNVMLEDTYEPDRFHIEVTNGAQVNPETGLVQFSIGDVGPGESGEVWYSVQFNHEQPLRFTTVESASDIMSTEDDWIPGDNTQGSSNLVFMDPNYYAVFTIEHPSLAIAKKHNFMGKEAFPGDVVHYTIDVENTGDVVLYEVKVFDSLIDQSDARVAEKHFDIGQMLPQEKVRVEYDVPIVVAVPAGTYTNYAIANGFTSSDVFAVSDEASAQMTVGVHATGGASGGFWEDILDVLTIGRNGLGSDIAAGDGEEAVYGTGGLDTSENTTGEADTDQPISKQSPTIPVTRVAAASDTAGDGSATTTPRGEREMRAGVVLGASEDGINGTSTMDLVTSTVASLTSFAPIFPADNSWGWVWIALVLLLVLYGYVHKKYGTEPHASVV